MKLALQLDGKQINHVVIASLEKSIDFIESYDEPYDKPTEEVKELLKSLKRVLKLYQHAEDNRFLTEKGLTS